MSPSPRLFLHKLDSAARTGTFVRTTPAMLRATPFLDGRTPYWQGLPIEAPLSASEPGPGPQRILFHIGFCGSTLLATLLDQPGSTLVLREPQALTDLAAHKSALDREGRHDPALPALLADAGAALRRPWVADEPVVIKPSNWVNNLLPDITANHAQIRPLFLTMARRGFVRAVLRGGPARLAFAARACVHLGNADKADAARIAQALASSDEADERLLALAVLLYDIQLALFQSAAKAGGWDNSHWLSLEGFRADPAAGLIAAARALAVAPPPPGHTLSYHAKQPGTLFSADAEAQADSAIEAAHGIRIDRALALIDGLS
jgi:hypothetical protein